MPDHAVAEKFSAAGFPRYIAIAAPPCSARMRRSDVGHRFVPAHQCESAVGRPSQWVADPQKGAQMRQSVTCSRFIGIPDPGRALSGSDSGEFVRTVGGEDGFEFVGKRAVQDDLVRAVGEFLANAGRALFG